MYPARFLTGELTGESQVKGDGCTVCRPEDGRGGTEDRTAKVDMSCPPDLSGDRDGLRRLLPMPGQTRTRLSPLLRLRSRRVCDSHDAAPAGLPT